MSNSYHQYPGSTLKIVTPLYPEQKKSGTAFRILFIGKEDSAHRLKCLQEHDVVSVPNYYQAIILLQRFRSHSRQMPEVVIGDFDKRDIKGLRDFTSSLSKDSLFSFIPFLVIDASKEFPKASHAPRSFRGIDEIITEEITCERFQVKVTLLRKFKALKQQQLNKNDSFAKDIPNARRVLYKTDVIIKRMMDVIISSIALMILSPLMLVISILIKMDSKGPVFYKSPRAGSNYRIFKFIKFRTMIAEADHHLSHLMSRNQYGGSDKKEPVFVKISNDPRITRLGKFLRNTSLDELPQLFNVLKGDMSLVGNRPLPLYEAKTLTTDSMAERFSAPAGITGLWQISKRGQKNMSVDERIALDIKYARDNSFTRDLQIMLKTPRALIQKDNV